MANKKMAYKTRTNPRTGETEYKVRYYFVEEGKKRDSMTGWFSSYEKAEKEAIHKREAKMKAERNKQTQKRNKLLITAFEEHIDELKRDYETTKKNTYKQYISDTRAVRNNHMPYEIQNTKIQDLTPITFKLWMKHMNDKPTIGGNYIRSCLSVLSRFNVWLSQSGYYLDETMEGEVETTIRAYKIKNRQVNNKEKAGKRSLISTVELENITKYYYEKGIDKFENFYLYTLFYVLFYGGMRVEELVGLQWKFIDLRPSERTISIKNAIADGESTEIALERIRRGEYRTKNITSVRVIPIFDFYYELLLDYKESYKYEFGLSDEEVEEGFVFPRITRKDPFSFVKALWLRKRLKEAIDALGMKKTDLQMFRHSCAMFLILLPPEGLGYSEEEVKDYFGHTDTDMLRNVYAKLNTMQKSERMRATFTSIYKPIDTDDRTEIEIAKSRMIERIKGDNEKEKREVREDRITKQIQKAERDKKKVYYYNKKDEEIINKYKEKHRTHIEFIEG